MEKISKLTSQMLLEKLLPDLKRILSVEKDARTFCKKLDGTYGWVNLKEVADKLQDLEDNNKLTLENAKDIESVSRLTNIFCHSCDKVVHEVIAIEYEYDGDDATLDICKECIEKSLKL